jgi:hypothetical protein
LLGLDAQAAHGLCRRKNWRHLPSIQHVHSEYLVPASIFSGLNIGFQNGDVGMSENSPGRAVIDPFGEPLTIDRLPPADTVRWVVRRKAQVVCAIREGLITRQDACDRYGISDVELFSWERLLEDHGPKALHTTKTQRYRQAATSADGDVPNSTVEAVADAQSADKGAAA